MQLTQRVAGDVLERVSGDGEEVGVVAGHEGAGVVGEPHTWAATAVTIMIASALLMPMEGRNVLTPWGSAVCGLLGTTPASLLRTTRPPSR